MDENNIHDVEKFEDVNNRGESFDNIQENNISGEFSLEDKSFVQSDDLNVNEGNINNKKRKKGGFKTIAIALIAGLLGGAIGGSGVYYALKGNSKNTQYKNVTIDPQSFSTSGEALTVSDAFNKVAPAVVVVSVSGVTDYSGIIPKETEGIGSGFIINEEGYILTNYHVIEGAKDVSVTLSDGRDVKAKVVNYDQNQDVAMIKISDETVKVPAFVELGNSDTVKPGEEVLAIGTPLSKDFNQTVTSGIISAVNRSVETSNGVKLNLIQTDAAINPGNSGGPLVNTKGEVIGINTMKISSDQVEGIGFSIPINEISDRIESLSKPILNLGVSIREIDETTAKQYNMEKGLYVVEVSEFSPAEKAGIKGGDIIVKFDGKKIQTFDELKAIRDTKSAGDTVGVEVIRNGESKTFNVQLEEKQ